MFISSSERSNASKMGKSSSYSRLLFAMDYSCRKERGNFAPGAEDVIFKESQDPL